MTGCLAAVPQSGHELDLWLEQQAPKLNTGRELEALRQVKTAYDDYIAAPGSYISGSANRARRITGRVQAISARNPSTCSTWPGAGPGAL